MTSHPDSFTQGNLEAHKDNPFRDNLPPLVVRLCPIVLNLLVTQAHLLFRKFNLDSSRVILLDKLVNLMVSQTNLMSSVVNHLDRWVILVFSRADPPSSTLKHLDMVVNLIFHQVNQLSRPIGLSAN